METLKIIHPDLMPFEAVEAELSPYRCDNCGTHITQQDEWFSRYWTWYEEPYIECGNCGGSHDGSITVIPSSAHLLSQEEVRNTIWYHTTSVENWFQKVSTGHGMEDAVGEFLYVHVGIEDAARHVAQYKYFNHLEKERVMMYQVRLKTDAVLSPHVVHDNETWGDFNSVTDETREVIGGDAIRYLNRCESAGSISLLVDARQLELVGVEQIHNPRFNLPSELKKKLPQLGLSKMCA
jgi:hypothetical protein